MRQGTIEGFRLSPQQKYLWSLQQEAASQIYRAQCTVQITGPLDTDALRTALQSVVERHEILRTVFQCLPGMDIPLQVVVEEGLAWEHTDLRGPISEDQSTQLDALLAEVAQRSFNLGHGPLVHVLLISLADDRHTLSIALPALCADYRSLSNLLQEIGRTYAAIVAGEDPSNESLQYADLAEVLNELLESEETEAGRAFWRTQNVAAATTLKLRIEQPGANTTFDPQRISRPVAPELAARIAAIAEQQQVPSSVFFLAGWQILLSRLSGEHEIVIGVACDGRNYDGLEEALGLFQKDVLLSMDLADRPTFEALLGKVHAACSTVYKRQEYFSWEHYQSNADAKALFCRFSFAAQQSQALTIGDLRFAPTYSACTDRFVVKLSLVQRDHELSTDVEYDASRISAAVVERLVSQLFVLLRGAAEQPGTPVDRLPILGDAERAQLLVAFNQTARSYRQDVCSHQLFEEQALKTPDASAVVYADRQLNYAELNRRANQLAHYLRKAGVGPDVRVGIAVERSPELIVGLLAILKAGGAYLPLDLSHPGERIQFMLADANVPVLLTQQRQVAALPEYAGRVISVDADWSSIAEEPVENPVSGVQPENLAYLIYTSGSTGAPKGVCVHHAGLVNYLSWCLENYPLDKGSGAPVHSSIAFDLPITSLFAPLLAGQSVHLLSEEAGVDGLVAALRTADYSLVKITPAHLELLRQQLSPADVVGGTKAFIIGGENLLGTRIKFWQEHAPDTLLVNEYGPTETVVGCCVYRVDPTQPIAGSVPIGRPIANTQIYILDPYGEPTPIGSVGELFIGGAGVAQGYLNRPDLTAEKFLPDPFIQTPGARLYRTGDLACHLPGGQIEYLGRNDGQVKVRGYRIELGEIETVLEQHPKIQEVVVLAREDEPNDLRLAAYVVARQTFAPSSAELREFLSEKLPEHMIPSAFVMLDQLPLTSNGKVDRKALPAPDQSRPAQETEYVPPRTPLEDILSQIWVQTLKVERVGIHDNFFALGGHSLLATQILSRVRETFHAEVPLQRLFEHPTVLGLAETIIANESKPGQTIKIAQVLKRLEGLSPEELKRTLETKKSEKREA
jgi:amino acid adenylation domain-containing protein